MILGELEDIDRRIEYHETARVLAARSGDPEFIGRIGLLSAGTSDIPVAEEARVVAEESGCEVIRPMMLVLQASTGSWTLEEDA